MTVLLPGGPRHGLVNAVPSKSAAHRLFYCAALGTEPCTLPCDPLSDDLAATLACLGALGAGISLADGAVHIAPIRLVPSSALLLPCGESGTTLRFLLPLAGVLGVQAAFDRRGRLPARPLSPFAGELERHGLRIREDGALLRVSGRLRGGDWTLPGDVSSQFISALLLALPLLAEPSTLAVTGRLESAPYVALTEELLRTASIRFDKAQNRYTIPGGQRPQLPPALAVEGDWSAAAPFLAMGALSDEGVTVAGLRSDSAQGDRAIAALLRRFGAEVLTEPDRVTVRKKDLRGVTVDVSQTPDLAPVAAALGALAAGETRIENAARLRLKESDRLAATAALLSSLGADVRELPDGLVVRGKAALPGGVCDSFDDHRLAMAAAVVSCGCAAGLTLRGADCVGKSCPRFWEDFASLGGTQ